MTISLADGGNCCPWVIVARLTKSCQEFTGDFRHNSNSSLPFALTLFTMMMTFFFPPLNWQRVAVLLSRFFSTSCLCEKKLFYDFIFSSLSPARRMKESLLPPPLDIPADIHSFHPRVRVDPSQEKRETSDPHVLLITQDSTALTLAIDRLQWFHHPVRLWAHRLTGISFAVFLFFWLWLL
jgi:hypothetical protein